MGGLKGIKEEKRCLGCSTVDEMNGIHCPIRILSRPDNRTHFLSTRLALSSLVSCSAFISYSTLAHRVTRWSEIYSPIPRSDLPHIE